jgi:Tfp pilus assembly protein PilO
MPPASNHWPQEAKRMANKAGNSGSSRFFLIGGYTVLVAAFAFFGLLHMRGVNTARAAIAQDQGEIEARQAKTRELREISSQVDEIKLETRDFDRLVPPNQDFGTFLEDVATLLSESGMRDVSYHNLSVNTLGRSERLPIEVRGRCTFPQFHTFLTKLEGLKRLSSVGKMSIDASSDMNGEIEVQLTLYIYNAKPAS